ncbi:MAG: GNAT family N-acetyltransferase, partial [Caulobacteraceae bacterium]
MAGPPIPTLDLVRRAQAMSAGYTRQRLAFIAERPGNPLGAEVRAFGDALALRAKGFPAPHFNRGYGFSDERLDEVREVLDWFEEAGVAGGFEIAPGAPMVRMAALLASRGLAHTGFHATFVGTSDLLDAPSRGIEVRELESEAELGAFADVYHRGWDIPGFRIPMRPWLDAPGWRLYLALCEGAPAGAAIVWIDADAAYLADSAVDPAFRRRGVHRALLD